MNTQSLIKPDDYFRTAEAILLDFKKIDSLSKKKCFFCFMHLGNSKFSYVESDNHKNSPVYTCCVCIIKIALKQITANTKKTKVQYDLAQVISQVTECYTYI